MLGIHGKPSSPFMGHSRGDRCPTLCHAIYGLAVNLCYLKDWCAVQSESEDESREGFPEEVMFSLRSGG